MCVSLLKLDIGDLTNQRQEIRALWKADFEKNHKIFAEKIAHGIANQVISELGNTIKNPYKQPISFNNKLESKVYFDITSTYNTKIIGKFIENQELAPFNEWLTEFAKDQSNLTRDDRKHFKELMVSVGRLAEEKLKEIFSEFTSRTEHKDLQFKVVWNQTSDHLPQKSGFNYFNPCVSSSSYNRDYLMIELWFNEKSKQTEENNSTSTITQKKLPNTRKRNIIIMTMAIAFIGLILLGVTRAYSQEVTKTYSQIANGLRQVFFLKKGMKLI